jgi:hypothetical protein
VFSPPGEIPLPGGVVSPVFFKETVMKEAVLNVVMDLKLMVLIFVLSQVIALAKTIA